MVADMAVRAREEKRGGGLKCYGVVEFLLSVRVRKSVEGSFDETLCQERRGEERKL
jgi:hypothetical protein